MTNDNDRANEPPPQLFLLLTLGRRFTGGRSVPGLWFSLILRMPFVQALREVWYYFSFPALHGVFLAKRESERQKFVCHFRLILICARVCAQPFVKTFDRYFTKKAHSAFWYLLEARDSPGPSVSFKEKTAIATLNKLPPRCEWKKSRLLACLLWP